MFGRRHLGVVLTISGAALMVVLPAVWLSASRYSALTGGVQALGVVIALGFAATTLSREGRDRRVDRTLQLHDALTSGELQQARFRIVEHVRVSRSPDRYQRITREHAGASVYANPTGNASPLRDLTLILRFFERANAVRMTGGVYEPLFHELIGFNALWLDELLREEPAGPRVDGLRQIARWAREFPTKRQMYPDHWAETTRGDQFD